MVAAFQERRDFLVGRLKALPGVRLAEPAGAFYVLPELADFCGPGAEAQGFGPVPDVDTLCRCAPLVLCYISRVRDRCPTSRLRCSQIQLICDVG